MGRKPKSLSVNVCGNEEAVASQPHPPSQTTGTAAPVLPAPAPAPAEDHHHAPQAPAPAQAQAQGATTNPVADSAPFSLIVYRHYNPPRQHNDEIDTRAKKMNEYSEAILHKVLQTDSVPSLMMAMNGEWILNTQKEGKRVKLCNDIYLSVTRNDRSDWDVNALELTLTSSKKSANQLVRYVEQLHEEYQHHVNNALRGNIYFFDHKEFQDFRGTGFEGTASVTQRRFDIINAPKHLSFQRLPFHSNKTFQNLCGPEVELIAKRVDFFMKNKEWYDSKGIPWQVGFMFSGDPGCGKSSCIRAIANHTGRHIINVNFCNIKTVTQLKKLFYSDDIDVYKDDESRETVRLKIPVDQRIYVMEEIDALGKTVLERRGWEDDAVYGRNGIMEQEHKVVQDEITLADLLHVLDGNMETPGRMVIVTCKSPHLLDEAIIRPGRIDVNVKFELASRETIANMYEKMHEEPLTKGLVLELPDKQLSPADVMEVMFRNFGTKRSNMAQNVVNDLKRRGECAASEKQSRANAVRDHISNLSRMRGAVCRDGHEDAHAVPTRDRHNNRHSTTGSSYSSDASEEEKEKENGRRSRNQKQNHADQSFHGNVRDMNDTYEAFLAACDDDTLVQTRGGNNSGKN